MAGTNRRCPSYKEFGYSKMTEKMAETNTRCSSLVQCPLERVLYTKNSFCDEAFRDARLFCALVFSDPGGKKETKKKIASGVLAAAVVGFLIVVFVMGLLLHLAVKKIKQNVQARRRGSTKYVNDSNISSNGKAVTIGTRNKGFEDEIKRSESALY